MARCLFVNSLIFQVFMCLTCIIETSPYEPIYLEQTNVCSLRDGGSSVIKIGKDEYSSKIVTESTYFDRWSGRYKFSCSFVVKAPSNYGVYAVIQTLNLRKNEITGSCKDYVEFQIPHSYFPALLSFFQKGDKVTKRFCGTVSASETSVFSEQRPKSNNALSNLPLAENGFVAKNGLLQVTIYIEKEKLEPGETLDISVVFTSYKEDCKKRDKSVLCRECEWIWEGLQLDKVQNCPYKTCLDEDFCKNLDGKNEIRNVVSSGTGTKVSIGAVATIILMLLMFACCVGISRRFQLWCFDPSSHSRTRMEMNSTQRTPRAEGNAPYGDIIPEDTSPSAPPISEDKDLPPSYSSLFPGR